MWGKPQAWAMLKLNRVILSVLSNPQCLNYLDHDASLQLFILDWKVWLPAPRLTLSLTNHWCYLTAVFGPTRDGILRSEPGISVILETCSLGKPKRRTFSYITNPMRFCFGLTSMPRLSTVATWWQSILTKTGFTMTSRICWRLAVGGEFPCFTMKTMEQPTPNIMRILGGSPTAPDVGHGGFLWRYELWVHFWTVACQRLFPRKR